MKRWQKSLGIIGGFVVLVGMASTFFPWPAGTRYVVWAVGIGCLLAAGQWPDIAGIGLTTVIMIAALHGIVPRLSNSRLTSLVLLSLLWSSVVVLLISAAQRFKKADDNTGYRGQEEDK